MGLSLGYTETEIGVLPTEWPLVPLSELFEFQNGVNADKRSYGAGIRFVNVLEVITKSHLYALDIPGRVALPAQRANAYLVRRGDVLFNRTSETQEEVGLAAVYEGNEAVVFGGFVIRGRRVPSAHLDPTYLGYALRSPHVRRQIVARGQGAIRANIGQADLRTVLLPIPPPEEQSAIGEALGDTDALIESLEQLLTKNRQIKQGAMQDLLDGRRRLLKFDEPWSVRMLKGRLLDEKRGEHHER